jgi:hypothetical protein
MKTAWPHLLNLLLIIFIILLLTGLIGTRFTVKATDPIFGQMKTSKAKAALLIDADGKISAIKEDGEQIKECSVGPHGKYPQCEGLGPKGTVLTSQMFNILTVRGSSCIEIIDGNGKATEYCW